MQVGNVSWIAQPFVFGRYSNGLQEKKFYTFALKNGGSPEKKTRQRKTKEERREMVESFIIRYRSSNNGTFPSLNLTHKEVGGSFYIVREIVRDIIQENRILGPGSMDLAALCFDDCPDPTEEFHVHEMDEENIEVMHMPDQNQVSKTYESAASSDSQETSPTQQNVVTDQQILNQMNILDAGLVNSVVQDDNGAAPTYSEKSLRKHNAVPSKNSRKNKRNVAVEEKLETSLGKQNEEPYNDDELDNTDEPIPFTHPVSDLGKEIMSNDRAIENGTVNITEAANLLQSVSCSEKDASGTVGQITDDKQCEVNNDSLGTNIVAGGAMMSFKTIDPSQTTGACTSNEHVISCEQDISSTIDQITDDKQLFFQSVASAKENNDSHLSHLGTKDSLDSEEVSEVRKPINDVEQQSLPNEEVSIVTVESKDSSSTSVDVELEKMPSQGLIEMEKNNEVIKENGQLDNMLSVATEKEHIVSNVMSEHISNDATWISKYRLCLLTMLHCTLIVKYVEQLELEKASRNWGKS